MDGTSFGGGTDSVEMTLGAVLHAGVTFISVISHHFYGLQVFSFFINSVSETKQSFFSAL